MMAVGIFSFLFFIPVVQFDYQKEIGRWDAWSEFMVFQNGTTKLLETIYPYEYVEFWCNYTYLEKKYNCVIYGGMYGGSIYEIWHYSGSILHYLFKIGYGVEWKIGKYSAFVKVK